MTTEEELWKVIPLYPEYEASSYGRIRTITRRDSQGRLRKSKVLKQTLDAGYYNVGVGKLEPTSTARIYTIERVHRLIAMAFYGCPKEGLDKALHRNDVKTDNRVFNLYWGSVKDNGKDMMKNGNHKAMKGESNGCSVLKEEEVLFIRKFYTPRDRDTGARALARKFRVGKTTILRVVNKTHWRHL